MDKETQVITDVQVNETGKVVFAPDVVATIANIAATQVEGVSDLGGGFADSISGIFGGKKNYTKGVRVEVGSEEAAVDLSINVKYGCKIQDVSNAVQEAVKNQIESMTGLRVVEVNVYVQSVTFEQEKVEKPEKKKPEDPPRVR